jgi:transcriptional regulator with XRE-family HTH domain
MVILRIQEYLDARGLTIAELAQLTSIEEESLRTYSQESINLNQENTEHLRRIATKLNVPVAKLIRPAAKQAGISFKILEKAKSQGLDLAELSRRSEVHPLLLAIYSTQVLLKDKWGEEQTQDNINRIAAELNSSPEELIKIEDPPITQLRMDDFLREKGMSIDDLSLLYNAPREAFELLASQPLDTLRFKDLEKQDVSWGGFCCFSGFCPC